MNPISWIASFFRRRPIPSITMGGPTRDVATAPRGPIVVQPSGRVWELTDRESAMVAADTSGDFHEIARICDAMLSNGLIRGLLDIRAGVLSFPMLYEGDPYVTEQLQGRPARYDKGTSAILEPETPGRLARILVKPELRRVYDDGLLAGAGVGYLQDDPRPGGWRRLKHLDLHWLRYQHHDDSWWYLSAKRGRIRVTPGDGRWCLFTPYGRSRPWTRGLWYPAAGPFIAANGTELDRVRWGRFLADALRLITLGDTASEVHIPDMVRFLREGWQFAPGLVAPKGYGADIVESNGRGYEVYADTDETAERKLKVTFTGSNVLADGGKGFSSGDIWNTVAHDLIQDGADSLSCFTNEEVIDPFTLAIGLGAGRARVSWDARDPQQKILAAEAGKAAAEEIEAIDKIAAPRGQRVQLDPFLAARGVDVQLEPIRPAAPTSSLATPRALPAPVAGLLPPPASEAVGSEGDDSARVLAEAMTRHSAPECEHGRSNRCPLCGVERERELVPGKKGQPHTWRVKWRPITTPATASRGVSARYVGGLPIVVQHPAGSLRTGRGPDGPWAVVMAVDYGEIVGTVGADGEAVDAYVGPKSSAEMAYVVEQLSRDGAPDEAKVILGFTSEAEAKAAYLAHVPPWCFGSISPVPVSGLLEYLDRYGEK